VSNFLLARYDLAFKDFDEALLYLRGNESMSVAHRAHRDLRRLTACAQ
jgi:hypothetical protein